MASNWDEVQRLLMQNNPYYEEKFLANSVPKAPTKAPAPAKSPPKSTAKKPAANKPAAKSSAKDDSLARAKAQAELARAEAELARVQAAAEAARIKAEAAQAKAEAERIAREKKLEEERLARLRRVAELDLQEKDIRSQSRQAQTETYTDGMRRMLTQREKMAQMGLSGSGYESQSQRDGAHELQSALDTQERQRNSRLEKVEMMRRELSGLAPAAGGSSGLSQAQEGRITAALLRRMLGAAAGR